MWKFDQIDIVDTWLPEFDNNVNFTKAEYLKRLSENCRDVIITSRREMIEKILTGYFKCKPKHYPVYDNRTRKLWLSAHNHDEIRGIIYCRNSDHAWDEDEKPFDRFTRENMGWHTSSVEPNYVQCSDEYLPLDDVELAAFQKFRILTPANKQY